MYTLWQFPFHNPWTGYTTYTIFALSLSPNLASDVVSLNLCMLALESYTNASPKKSGPYDTEQDGWNPELAVPPHLLHWWQWWDNTAVS